MLAKVKLHSSCSVTQVDLSSRYLCSWAANRTRNPQVREDASTERVVADLQTEYLSVSIGITQTKSPAHQLEIAWVN